jgi:dihydrofolate reductase
MSLTKEQVMVLDKLSEEDVAKALKERERYVLQCNCFNGRSGRVFGGISNDINKPPRLSYESCHSCKGKRYIVPRKDLNISMIAAMSWSRAIGDDNKLLWSIPEDLKYFRRKTNKKSIIMGRKTHESIGRLLPNRLNIIVTRKLDYKVEGAIVVNSIRNAILSCDLTKEIMIIGGGEIYKEAMPFANKLYITMVDSLKDGDTYFPEILSEWEHHSRDDHPGTPSYSFHIYKLREEWKNDVLENI